MGSVRTRFETRTRQRRIARKSNLARRDLRGLRILLTGATSGIGLELALQLARHGADLTITGRRDDRLQKLCNRIKSSSDSEATSSPARHDKPRPSHASTSIQAMAGDLTQPAFRSTLIDEINHRWGALDVLINNAGAGAIGAFSEADPERLRRVMEIDFFAPVELTRLSLPLLKRGKQPAIMNVGSVLSHRAVPLKSEYCAAKFALRGWSEALRSELYPEHIDVLHVSPSTTKTEFFGSLIDSVPDSRSKSIGSMTPDRVAAAIIRSLKTSKRETIISLGGQALVQSNRLAPRLLDQILALRKKH